MVIANKVAAIRLTNQAIIPTDPIARTEPNSKASFGNIGPEGIGRLIVRFMTWSISSSYHMLIAPEAPAPRAMQIIDIIAVLRSIVSGAKSNPVKAVNITSDITRGFKIKT